MGNKPIITDNYDKPTKTQTKQNQPSTVHKANETKLIKKRIDRLNSLVNKKVEILWDEYVGKYTDEKPPSYKFTLCDKDIIDIVDEVDKYDPKQYKDDITKWFNGRKHTLFANRLHPKILTSVDQFIHDLVYAVPDKFQANIIKQFGVVVHYKILETVMNGTYPTDAGPKPIVSAGSFRTTSSPFKIHLKNYVTKEEVEQYKKDFGKKNTWNLLFKSHAVNAVTTLNHSITECISKYSMGVGDGNITGGGNMVNDNVVGDGMVNDNVVGDGNVIDDDFADSKTYLVTKCDDKLSPVPHSTPSTQTVVIGNNQESPSKDSVSKLSPSDMSVDEKENKLVSISSGYITTPSLPSTSMGINVNVVFQTTLSTSAKQNVKIAINNMGQVMVLEDNQNSPLFHAKEINPTLLKVVSNKNDDNKSEVSVVNENSMETLFFGSNENIQPFVSQLLQSHAWCSHNPIDAEISRIENKMKNAYNTITFNSPQSMCKDAFSVDSYIEEQEEIRQQIKQFKIRYDQYLWKNGRDMLDRLTEKLETNIKNGKETRMERNIWVNKYGNDKFLGNSPLTEYDENDEEIIKNIHDI